MKPIRTERLILRNWEQRDRALFHRINSDERVMEFFPFRRDRAAADAKMDELRAWIDEDGYGFAAAEIAATGECIGFVGLLQTDHVPSLPAGTIEIGWRLAPEYWRKGYVTEASEAWLSFGFETLELDEIVSFAVVENHRSIAVMKRLGMRADPGADFDHPAVPDSHPHLKRHALYRLSRDDWQARKRAAR
ncbi:N-acetyltransferase [Mesorhizobium sp. M1A.F.Ca.IN.022.07.1.1]|uniref:GNAT family N-acetyltransferase n=18 Tax=Mesorhizobium TaxID=68287 RepID=UPI0007FC29AE|nr:MULTISPECIES: GNAT family N-acetyltransferase [unclassified Mesorhizobium]TGV93287.1 N-acetyltransferase [Mesorhizobium sp. M00.F.Ca.ET.158.01.1.1]AZO62329.1 N-acetyltransferase [Mesorhizobium sp. M1A.F.Ca.IN.022.06.1.1]MCT2577269.1 GNAT family N-acetyltransferase [Mesorhizobium sp. P13.3]MDF3166207.1 GNAT family N-acetyltransferase [Mesorhizobium sp. P16.1]MDF3180837.1 GNAT family N-acetyltransferase [Mesorhizobium sp. P17.1]